MKRGLAAFVVGMLWGSFAWSSSMCGLVGAWQMPGPNPSDLVVVSFMRDGRFMLVEASPANPADPTGTPGFERGTFSVNPTTGLLSLSFVKDMNGQWGFSNGGPIISAVSGNNAVFIFAVDGPFPFTRVRDAAVPIVGSWLFESGGDVGVLTFLDNGTYVYAQDGTPAGGGTPGIERGHYTWDTQTGAFTATADVLNTDGDWGLSSLAGPIVVTVVGSTMTFSDDNSVFRRVRPNPACVRKDHDGDGKADLLWRNTGGISATGQTYLYPMDGTTIKPTEGFIRTVEDLDWRIEARGDFNGDGMADILWRHYGTGANYIYLMNGTTIIGEGFIRTVADLAWHVERVNDFNGDRKDDILWRHSVTGETYIYPMDGLTILSTEGFSRTVADLTWGIERAADFDGDGRADILWRNTQTGQNYIYFMDGTTIKSEGFIRTVADLNWDVQGAGDFDDDGFADILWRNTATGENYIYHMQGTTIHAEGFLRTVDLTWVIADVGDFDGDGKSDIVWRNTVTGDNYIYFMDGTTIKPTEGFIRNVIDPLWTISPAPLHEAVVRINEVSSRINNFCGLIELRVVLGGRMGGMRLFQRTNNFLRFSAFNVAKNDIIIVHANTINPGCGPGGKTNETSGKAQFPVADGHLLNYDTAWDWWVTQANFNVVENDSVISIQGRFGNIIDAVFLANVFYTLPLNANTETRAAAVAAAGEWQQVGGGVPVGGFVGQTFVDHAVRGLDQPGPGNANSVQRIDNGDTNTKADWTAAPAPSSFGQLNAGQTPF